MPSDGAGGRSGGDGDRGSGGSTGGRGGGGGGGGGRNKDDSGFNSLSPSRDSRGNAVGVSGARAGGNRNAGAPSGLRSIADMQRGLSIAGPQLSRVRGNAFATALSHGLTALGVVTGFPGFSIASKAVSLARDYGRGYADRTAMEKAAAANGMGETQRGGDALSSGLSGIAKVKAKYAARQQSQTSAPAQAAASGNVGSGAAGATVIMGADKTRTGAGAGGRAKGSAVRGFGSSGLRI